MSAPRIITAAEVLAERTALRETMTFPHGTGRGWTSMYWVSCDCPNCADEYDPTGEETAKYFNMDPSSFYTDQSEMRSLAFSKLAIESFFCNATPGFYFDTGVHGVRTLDELLTQLTPPLALYPRHIHHIGQDRVINRFFLSKDTTYWVRSTWKNGRSVFYKEGTNPSIPFDTANSSLRKALSSLFHA